ncbi:radial spoke head 10 homolog B isoform X2 [Mastacembelus armatus]|uniref:radial spoke head 10 homolog B isoform X2 n=1 Tax=Mastacembelus armatus TaxID=205130 RepID=UPI000E46590E|nr:radial spoke head 10 homolog B2 isoform X2 [Mastacembelus armatus]
MCLSFLTDSGCRSCKRPHRCHGKDCSLYVMFINSAKMTQGAETTTVNDKWETEKTCGGSELPQLAGERANRELVRVSAVSKANPADVDHDQTDLRGHPVSDEQPDNELPTLFNVTVLRYEGETYEGQFHGEGAACFEGGHTYKGMFSRGLMNGSGVFIWADGLKYEGEFVCNMPMGQGTYMWPDGSSYAGEVYSSIRHGTGTYKCAKSGVLYNGQWDKGKRHGKGTVYYNQDKTSWYKGDWVKNNREGWGVRCYPSGNIYSGEWKNNQRHGEGTMRWLKLGQQYFGKWMNGVQHGQGTHVWIPKRANGSQYSQRNQYTGNFLQGQRHGWGTFYYAGGAVYEGEWKNNKKHGKSKFTFKDGHVFEGEFMDDQMRSPNLPGKRVPTPLCDSDSSVLGPDMALNIECLLDKIPEKKRNTERKQVGFVVLRQDAELRSIYRFYSRLGHTHAPDNTFMLSRLQFWRLLKDCNIHHHDITLTQIDHFLKEDTITEIHSPFTPMFFHRLVNCLVIVAYHIYNKDMASQTNLLASCLSKLMTDNILPNAKNVKGFLFGQPDHSVVAVDYMQRCWEVYQAYCRDITAHRNDQTMTYRQLLWMFKDLHLLDNKLTIGRLLEVITAECYDPKNISSCMDLEITFLEFFEVLLGCAKVKCQQVSEGLGQHQSLSTPDTEDREDLPKVPDSVNSPVTTEISSPKLVEVEKFSDKAEISTAQPVGSQQDVSEQPQPTEETEDHGGETQCVQTGGMETKHQELELWAQTVHQFFNSFFFPAFEHHRLVTRTMKEDKLQQQDQTHCSV